MGNKSKSKTDSSKTNERNETVSSAPLNLEPGDIENGDFASTAIAGTSVGKGADVEFTVTDQGAVQKSLSAIDKVVGRSYSFGRDALEKATGTAQAAAQQASNNMRTAVSAVRDTVSEQNETQQVIKGVAVVGTVMAVGIYLMNRGK